MNQLVAFLEERISYGLCVAVDSYLAYCFHRNMGTHQTCAREAGILS